MSWHATDTLDTAVAATKRLLLPFELKRWLVLAIVAFFVSGTTGFNLNTNITGGDGSVPIDQLTRELQRALPDVVASWVAVLILLGGLLLLIGIAMAYIGAVMEFVFVEIASQETVRIQGFFGNHLGSGLSLLALRLLVGFAVLSVTLVFTVLTALSGGLFLVFIVLLSPVLVLLGVGVWLLLRLTADFVVPVMIADDVGIIQGWRHFWPALVADWKQYGLYVAIRVLLGIVAGITVVLGFAIIAVALAIPFGIIGLGGYFLLVEILGLATVGTVFGVGVAILYAVAVLIVGTTTIQVPIQTYLRYYSLLVLGAVTPEFDLVEQTRMAVASDGSE